MKRDQMVSQGLIILALVLGSVVCAVVLLYLTGLVR